MIKVKQLKKCRMCGKEFKIFRSTDKFCSYKCANDDLAAKRAANPEKYRPTKKYTPIKQVSDKRKILDREYLRRRKIFLSLPQNTFCKVCQAAYNGEISLGECFDKMIKLNGGKIRTNEVHHMAGRVGDLYLDETHWLAASSIGHRWIHDNPKRARELGFLEHSTRV